MTESHRVLAAHSDVANAMQIPHTLCNSSRGESVENKLLDWRNEAAESQSASICTSGSLVSEKQLNANKIAARVLIPMWALEKFAHGHLAIFNNSN